MVEYNLLYIAVATVSLYLLYEKIAIGRRRAALIAKHGCKTAPTLKSMPLLNGIDIGLMFFKWVKAQIYCEQTRRLFKENGRTFLFPFIGTKRALTMDPQNIQAMLLGSDWELGWTRCRAFQPYVGDAVTASNGKTWAHGRSLLKPAFNRSQVGNLDLFEEYFQKVKNLIPVDGSTVDLQPIFHRFAMDVISYLLFGESLNSLQVDASKTARDVEKAYEGANMGVIVRLNMGWLQYFHRDSHFLKCCRRLRSYIAEYVERAMETKKSPQKAAKRERYIFVDELVKDTDDKLFLQKQLVSSLAAGRNTVASFLSSTFYLLARNQGALEKLRQEIKGLEDVPPTYDQLQKMTYLQWILNETLRLLPPAPFNERVAIRDTVLPTGGGPDGKSPVFIEKGRLVGYTTWVMHRDPEIWGPDAEEFRPERWETISKSDVRYWPFGGGPRVCPGQNLAMSECAYLTVRMLQQYSVLESRDDRPWKEKIGIVMKLGNGCQVALKNRQTLKTSHRIMIVLHTLIQGEYLM